MYNDSKYLIYEATSEDDETIKKIYESISYDSFIDIQFRRGDNPYYSICSEGEDSVILLVKQRESGNIMGFGCCCIHKMYVDGKIKRVGYLNGLKVLPKYRKANTAFIRAFAVMGNILKDKTDICTATMMKSMKSTQKMFEKKRKNMPVYSRQCEYTTFMIKPSSSACKLDLTKGYDNKLNEFYSENLPKYNLAKVNEIRGISQDNYVSWRKNGKVLAACAVHDDKKYKNFYLNGYNRIAGLLRYLPVKLLGLPTLPQKSSIVNTAVISKLLFDESVCVTDRKKFIRAASSFAKDHDILLIGATDTDTTYKALRKIPHYSLSSYLYTVEWNETPKINSRPVMCDVTLM